jgi:hypothetical protein
MHNTDLFSIVVAINHLSDAVQQIQDAAREASNGSWLKDYLMPIGTLLFLPRLPISAPNLGINGKTNF